MKHSHKKNFLILQVASIGLLVMMAPAVAQSDSTTTSTTASTTQAIPGSSEVTDIGGVPVRKDAWTWYWNDKARIDTTNSTGFWGDDAISNLFKNVANSVVLPFWNAAMEYDFVRAGLLLVIAGMLLGFGASLMMPKKNESK